MFGREGIVSAEKRFQGTSGFKIPRCQILQGRNGKRRGSVVFHFCVFFVILDVVCEKALG